jgi:hypothetical protein
LLHEVVVGILAALAGGGGMEGETQILFGNDNQKK